MVAAQSFEPFPEQIQIATLLKRQTDDSLTDCYNDSLTDCYTDCYMEDFHGALRGIGCWGHLFREVRFDFCAAGVDSIALLGILRGGFRNVV